jgi:hypothetical protein
LLPTALFCIALAVVFPLVARWFLGSVIAAPKIKRVPVGEPGLMRVVTLLGLGLQTMGSCEFPHYRKFLVRKFLWRYCGQQFGLDCVNLNSKSLPLVSSHSTSRSSLTQQFQSTG